MLWEILSICVLGHMCRTLRISERFNVQKLVQAIGLHRLIMTRCRGCMQLRFLMESCFSSI